MRIAIDMDEVIADPISKFLELYNRDFGVPLDLVLDAGKEVHQHVPADVNRKWYDYINEKGFFRNLPVIPGSIEAIQKLQEQHDVYIATAAMEFRNSLEDKFDWLQDHFPFIPWTNIIFCGNKVLDVDVLIDDRIKNFADFKGRPLLFSSPHNLLITDYERVDTWEQVLEKLL
jgi:5'(3')-deoxyribonucleotidase